jgi:hypothetical protein
VEAKAELIAEPSFVGAVCCDKHQTEEHMGFGRGMLLWLLGIPLPIIILLALFWHN